MRRVAGSSRSEGGFADGRYAAASLLDFSEKKDSKGRNYYTYELLVRSADGDEVRAPTQYLVQIPALQALLEVAWPQTGCNALALVSCLSWQLCGCIHTFRKRTRPAGSVESYGTHIWAEPVTAGLAVSHALHTMSSSICEFAACASRTGNLKGFAACRAAATSWSRAPWAATATCTSSNSRHALSQLK